MQGDGGAKAGGRPEEKAEKRDRVQAGTGRQDGRKSVGSVGVTVVSVCLL
jgi:hypothetical protein